MLEARGREIRLSNVSGGSINLNGGNMIFLNCQNSEAVSNNKTLYCNNDSIQRYLKTSDFVYFDDGKVVCIVSEITAEGLMLEVKIGGPVRSKCQIRFLNGRHKELSLLHENDLRDLAAVSQLIQIDYFVLPFATCN